MTVVIEAQSISKCYRIHEVNRHSTRSLRDSMARSIKHLLYSTSPFHTPHLAIRDHWALTDVSFQIRQGENVAVLGKNGSGKTTLFRILSRISMPTTGHATIHGKSSCLLQAGTGFHPELSGRENVFMNGMIIGMSRQEIRRKFDEIVAFSGVEEFIDVPLKFYSTGMQSRLGFSVAAHLDTQIMLLDEGMASGDSEFRLKSIQKIKEMSREGRTLLFVSHEPQLIREICSRALVMERGKLIEDTNDLTSLLP